MLGSRDAERHLRGMEHPLCHPCGSELRGVREAKGKRIPGWNSPASNLKRGLFLPLCSLPGKAAGKYFPGNCFCSFLCVCTHEALLRLGHASTCPEAQINPLHRQGRQLRSDAVSRGEGEEEETFPLGNHIRSQPEQRARKQTALAASPEQEVTLPHSSTPEHPAGQGHLAAGSAAAAWQSLKPGLSVSLV